MSTDPNEINEIAARGRKLYDVHIKETVDPIHYGMFVVIGVDTGDYEVDKRHILAIKRLRKRHPGALTYGVRVGFPTAYRMVGAKTQPSLE